MQLADSGFIFGHALKDTPTFASTMVYFSFGTLTSFSPAACRSQGEAKS
jgi:hypothetical protein